MITPMMWKGSSSPLSACHRFFYSSSATRSGMNIKNMLLYSSETEVYDSTLKKNTRMLIGENVLKMKYENEKLKSHLTMSEESNLSVALPLIYGDGFNLSPTTEADDIVVMDANQDGDEIEEDEKPVFPFRIFENPDFLTKHPVIESGVQKTKTRGGGRRKRTNAHQRQDYDVITDDLDEKGAKKLLSQDDMFRYGSADPEIPSSNVPCGSCGALLHCNDPKMPGFTPVEMFKGKSKKNLRSIICQRCYVMKEYNIALKMSVSPDFYPQTLKELHLKRALILLVVDLLDFPGSVWPGILDLLGPHKKIILVGNKADLLPQDSNNYLKRVEKSMKSVFLEKCNNGTIVYDPKIVNSILVSARTRFNVENLINMIYGSWTEHKTIIGSDIYLLGTTNVGKSSLFNLLLDSDLCKIQAADNVEKAMTSPVPGTTLNLLKFPIMRPDPSRMNARITRLRKGSYVYRLKDQERLHNLKRYRDRKYLAPIGELGRTFGYKLDKHLPLASGIFNLSPPNHKVTLPQRLDPLDPDFADGKWCYDTPGTVSKDQIINLLTQEEVRDMTSEIPITPKTYAMRNGQSLFIGGLARFDLLDGYHQRHPLLLTVFCADTLPINFVRTEDAEDFYNSALGSEFLRVPRGSKLRLREFPPLEGEIFEVDSYGLNEASSDIVLSSAGWVSCFPRVSSIIKVKAWTPGGRGIYFRDPPFLPYAHHLRGRRIKGTPAYKNDQLFMPNTFY